MHNEPEQPEPGDKPNATEGLTQTVRLPDAAVAETEPAERELAAGEELGPVRLIQPIGRGGMGTVWLGHHRLLGKQVAIKFLLPEHRGDAFLKEARAASALRHPNLVQVYHADIRQGRPYLVMEYIAGPSLRQLLRGLLKLDIPALLLILQDVADAVDELHRQGLIHRDIKPANVLLDPRGAAMVADFGLALRRPHAVGAAPAPFAGTPAYMAPECFTGEASARSDVYALGILCHELLTGRPPHDGDWQKPQQRPLPTQLLEAMGLGQPVIDVIERATHPRALFRYKSASDLLRAMVEASGQSHPKDIAAPARQARVAAMIDQARDPMASSATTWRRAADADDSDDFRQTIERLSIQKREQRRRLSDVDLPPIPALMPPSPASGQPAGPGMICLQCGHDISFQMEFDRCPRCNYPVVESIRPAAVAPQARPIKKIIGGWLARFWHRG